MESLETLGDCVLKMAVSATVYAERVEDHEGLLSKRRAKEVCNASLFHRVRALKIDVRLGAGGDGRGCWDWDARLMGWRGFGVCCCRDI